MCVYVCEELCEELCDRGVIWVNLSCTRDTGSINAMDPQRIGINKVFIKALDL